MNKKIETKEITIKSNIRIRNVKQSIKQYKNKK